MPDILATIAVPVTWDDRPDTQNIRVHVEFQCRNEDGETAELTRTAAVMVDSEGPEPTDKQVWQWAQEWLDGPGYLAACDRASEREGRR